MVKIISKFIFSQRTMQPNVFDEIIFLYNLPLSELFVLV